MVFRRGESNNLNAARMSAAGEGVTEPLPDLLDSLGSTHKGGFSFWYGI
jgi:hypothetical protein